MITFTAESSCFTMVIFNDKCLTAQTNCVRRSSSTMKDSSLASSHVCSRCCLPSLYPIDVTWSRDSEHPHQLSAVDRNPLAGSTHVRGPTSGDSFSLLSLV